MSILKGKFVKAEFKAQFKTSGTIMLEIYSYV
jgi:hypothetical protein